MARNSGPSCAVSNLAAKSHLLTDGFKGYQGRNAAFADRLKHTPVVQGDGPNAAEFFPIIHTVFSNMKAWLVGTHHGVSAKHLPRYLREWSYRFNRRNMVGGMDEFVLRRAMECASITDEQLVAGAMPGGATRNRRVQPMIVLPALAG
jgi:transposase-like protein